MENNDELLSKLASPTSKLSLDILKNVLISIQKARKISIKDNNFWTKMLESLWNHLQQGFPNVDDQLLCATCYYNVLTLIDKKEQHLKSIIKIIEHEISIHKIGCNENSIFLKTLSFIYGIFQSSLLSECAECDLPMLKQMLDISLQLILLKANEYTKFTFIIFKIIVSFRKVCQSNALRDTLFSSHNKLTLLDLVCHNWENPITGVRDLNKLIFKTLISLLDKSTYHTLLKEINEFPWNKAKYLMLSEIILQEKKQMTELVKENPDWIDGVYDSLYKPGLTSAGADMYYSMLKQLRGEDEWSALFYKQTLSLLKGSHFKAKETFFNYWCMNTFKICPKALFGLHNDLKSPDVSNDNLYSELNIIRQANRYGIVHNKWETVQSVILIGINYVDPYVRMLAFDIVCVSYGTCMPQLKEYDLVYIFIKKNVNSDCTVLRLSMLNSLKMFLKRLHSAYIHAQKHNVQYDIYQLHKFCMNLQMFIEQSLTVKGNYQRKITIVKICNVLIESLKEIPMNKNLQKQKSVEALLDNLKDNDCWILSNKTFIQKLLWFLNDPAEDVKENALQILVNHFAVEFIEFKFINTVTDEAFERIKSKFFYEISCGQTMFKLVTYLLIKHDIRDASFCNVEDLYRFLCSELILEHKSGNDILHSIQNGKQLNAFLSVLHCILNVCLQNNYSVSNLLSEETLQPLLQTLEEISNQFVIEEDNAAVSSDFSKMSDMVNNIILKSGYDPCSPDDKTKISGLHQIVLNSMWLNVKTSCELAAIIVTCHKQDQDINICRRCLDIIAHVLETSRHKGAIEAAGAALGQSIRSLTSLPTESELSKLPDKFLKFKLNEMICEANKMTSVTRRGAGLSIMVHRIVSNDMKKDKPLFHHFMKTLLNACKESEDVSGNINDNEVDLPKAIYIHFLTRIVTDSTLASDIMYYSANLAEIAFDHLTNDKWQIRNAALQLYGALVPKLIGQKKPSGDEEETVATVAFDEFRTHSPILWDFMQKQLLNEDCPDVIQAHSNLVPILYILSNCAKRYNFSNDMRFELTKDFSIFDGFMRLLSSPIYTVRRLTAKSIYNHFSFGFICNALLESKYTTQNFLHGSLLLVQICYKNYYQKRLIKKYFMLLKKLFNSLPISKHSYLCRNIFDEIFLDVNDEKYFTEVLQKCNRKKNSPGVFTWSNNVIHKYIKSSHNSKLSIMIHSVLLQYDFELCCSFIYTRIVSDKKTKPVILKDIAVILMENLPKYNSDIIWKTLYEISLKDISIFEDSPKCIIYNYFEDNAHKVTYSNRYVIPLIARLFPSKAGNIINCVYSLSNVEMDVDMRYVSALAVNETGAYIRSLSDEIKITIVKSVAILLQDEDEDVRNAATIFYKTVTENHEHYHPYICLLNILDHIFLNNLFTDRKNSIDALCEEFFNIIQEMSNAPTGQNNYNPFATELRNIYFESDVFQEIITALKNKNNSH